MIRILSVEDREVERFWRREFGYSAEVEQQVRVVLEQVREHGDRAVLQFTRQFDGAKLAPGNLRVSEKEIEEAYEQVDGEFLAALRRALDNIRRFHEKQKPQSWVETEDNGCILGQLYRPVNRVGIYVPGGSASYPSSVLMNAIPARVAGVPEIAMATPPRPDGKIVPHTLVAAAEAGVREIYKMGGAQAVAALAYGTETVPKVDKITGPGNIYVTLAKKLVYGQVDIDMLAGPSEILIIADETADPVHVAADLLSQAEHDPMASAVLITPSADLAQKVQQEVERQIETLPRRAIAEEALENYGAIILVEDLKEAVKLANRFAPEHLELMVEEPFAVLGSIRHAGAIFLGRYTPEAVGDYYAGPNHILPTGGTARFYSPLSVDSFMKKSSVISFSAEAFLQGSRDIIKLATVEGLDAHASSIRVRLEDRPGKE